MLSLWKRWFGKAEDPIAYRLPLDWFEVQLPGDLLATGFHWVWESSRAFKAVQASLPDERRPTVLTAALAPVFSAELGEYHLEAHREMTVFATAGPVSLSAVELTAAIRDFADSGEGPLVAILYQPPQGSSEVFLSRTPPESMMRLMLTWAERLGKPMSQVERVPGGDMLRRVFLNKQALAAGAIKGFPADTGLAERP